jgi:hypothetical protein
VLPIARVHHLGQIFSPFSGHPSDGENGPNVEDASLLFVFYGDASSFAFVSVRIQELIHADVASLEIKDLANLLEIEGGLILEVDTDWNGINYYGFAPTS